MHLLCYIAHLRIWTRALIQHETLTSLCLSLIPEGYITAAKHEFDVAIAERFMKWFRSAFQFTEKKFISKNGLCNSQVMFNCLYTCSDNNICLIDEADLLFSSIFYIKFFIQLSDKFRSKDWKI